MAAEQGCRSAVIFGNAHEDPAPETAAPAPAGPGSASALPGPVPRPALRQRLASIALAAGMELCGAGCMGFANVGYGLRAMGYVEPEPLPAGPVALVTHSGSVFSALLRTRRAFGFTLAVSSGQELVTAAPSYLSYALDQPETKVLALVLEAMREPGHAPRRADRRGTARSAGRPADRGQLGQRPGHGRRAFRGAGGLGRRLGGAGPCLRPAPGRRPGRDGRHSRAVLAPDQPPRSSHRRAADADAEAARRGRGIATVHDSGLERAHAADVADELGVPFATISETTRAGSRTCSTPACCPPTRSTSGEPAPAPGSCSPTR